MSWRLDIKAKLGTLALDATLEGAGRPTVLVGPNGAGKTTLLRVIAGSLTPESGRLELGGRMLLDTATGVDLPPEARRVGYVPQGYGLFPHLRAIDNVAFGLSQRATAQRRAVALQMLEQLGSAHLASRAPAALSGGERQRIALARALVVEPDLLLLDEPLSALDAPNRRSMRAFLVQHLAQRGKPAIVVTHDLRDVLALDADVFVLEAGRVVQRGSAQQLRDEPVNDFVAELFDIPAVATPES